MVTANSEYRILVIEDNPGDFALIEHFLLEQNSSPTIQQAEDFKTAKHLLLNSGCGLDVIFLDISLPDKMGEPLIKGIVDLALTVPVIVLTGYADFDFGVKSLSLGVSDYILKDEITALVLYKSIIYSIERKRINQTLETSEKRARNFANQLNEVLEEERARIAREIHDEFGQQLSGLKMALSSLKKFNGNYDDLQKLVEVLVTDVNISIASVRQIANELRPVILDKLGLVAAIEWLLAEFEKKAGVKTRLLITADDINIVKVTEINIFRICQEALTNISKHAHATLVTIQIRGKKNKLSIEITDNGVGIKPGNTHHPMSMGLQNMIERANLIGAELFITTALETGTLIKLNIK